MNKVISSLLILVGIIHLLPLSGVLGSEQLNALYGLSFNDKSLLILMQHRAILFGLLGTFFVFSAFKAMYQPVAFIAGFISVISFIVLAQVTEEYNQAIQNVVLADIVALVCLVIATVLYSINQRKN